MPTRNNKTENNIKGLWADFGTAEARAEAPDKTIDHAILELGRWRYGSRQNNQRVVVLIGGLLLERRRRTDYGEWYKFLERAQIRPNQAERWMRLAEAGLNPDDVVRLGGVGKALKSLKIEDLPDTQDDQEPPTGDRETVRITPPVARPVEPQTVRVKVSTPPPVEPKVVRVNVLPHPPADDRETPPLERPPSRAKVLDAELGDANQRIAELELRAAFEGEPEKAMEALETQLRVARSRINDLITESESLRTERDRWQKRAEGLAELVPCCVECDKPVKVEDRRCPDCAKAMMPTGTPAVK